MKQNVPARIVKNILFNQDRKYLPELKGITSHPIFDANENLIDLPGYNPDTQIYGDFQPDYKIQEPTYENAQDALKILTPNFSEFPFATHTDFSATMAAVLTAVVRPCLEQAPGISLTGTTFGSGKSYLANTIAAIASPDDPLVATYPYKSDEASKLVLSICMEQRAVVLFDDMQYDWKSHGPMNRLLTSPTVSERVLGSNRTASAPTRILILGTGNNIEPERDMRRRVVSIRLAPEQQNAAFRKFEHDPLEHVRKYRPAYVGLALTIINAYLKIGKLDKAPIPIGSYKQWSRFCREPLIWLGLPDPAESLIAQVTHDEDAEALGELIHVLFDKYGTKSVSVRTIVNDAEVVDDLKFALMALPVMDGKYINPNKLGWYLRKIRGRIVDGFCIESGDLSERRSWRVVPPACLMRCTKRDVFRGRAQ